MPDLAPIAERAQPPSSVSVPPESLGLVWRPLTRDDVPSYAELVNAVETADGLPYRTSPEEAAELFDSPTLRPEFDTILGTDPDGTARAWSTVTTFDGDTSLVRAIVSGGVHGEWRDRGIGTALVAWATARSRQVLAESGKDVPGRIYAYLDENQRDAEDLFRAAGYSPIRFYAELKRALDESLPAAAAPEGLRIEPWPDDDDSVRLAHNEAFEDHWGSQPRSPEDWLNYRSTFAQGWSFIAVDVATGEVAGYVKTGRYEHDWELAGYSSGYVNLLGVRRAWRGRGVARALLAATMTAQRADGIEYTEIGVDTANPTGAHGLYTSLGFEAFRSETMLSIEL